MSEADSVREMWDNSWKEMKSTSIKRLGFQLIEIRKHKDKEDYDNFLGYVSCLFDVRLLDLQESESFRRKAKKAMGHETL